MGQDGLQAVPVDSNAWDGEFEIVSSAPGESGIVDMVLMLVREFCTQA